MLYFHYITCLPNNIEEKTPMFNKRKRAALLTSSLANIEVGQERGRFDVFESLRSISLKESNRTAAADKVPATRNDGLLDLLRLVKMNVSAALRANESLQPLLWPIGDDESVNKCRDCDETFGSALFFSSTRGQRQCPLCLDILCAKCTGDELPLFRNSRASGSHSESIKIHVCRRCFQGVRRHFVEKSGGDGDGDDGTQTRMEPIQRFYLISVEVRQSIEARLGRFRDSVAQLDDDDVVSIDVDVAKTRKLAAALTEFFGNYELAVKKITALKPAGRQSRIVQMNVKSRLAADMQALYPQFRVLMQQLNKLLRSTEFKERVQRATADAQAHVADTPSEAELERRRARAIERQQRREQTRPIVDTIDPAACTLGGASLVITGQNFIPRTEVFVDGSACAVTFINNNALVAQSPPIAEQGHKSVRVVNPNGTDFELPNILLYTPLLDAADGAASALGIGDSPLLGASSPPPSSLLPSTFKGSSSKSDSAMAASSSSSPSSEKAAAPEITTVRPAMAPLKGLPMVITGRNFAKTAQVHIGNAPVPRRDTEWQRSTTSNPWCSLRFFSPQLPPGFKNVRVTNPDGQYAQLDSIVYYTNELPSEVFSSNDSSSSREHEQTITSQRHPSHRQPRLDFENTTPFPTAPPSRHRRVWGK
jgi:IPT/TIG domain/FYVE zinc finger